MKILSEDAKLVCKHINGVVDVRPTQELVTVAGRRVLVDSNPERRPIRGCPNMGPAIKPCQLTLAVSAGYSEWVRIEGQRVCLDTITGITDGTPPGLVEYVVQNPGQTLVSEGGKQS